MGIRAVKAMGKQSGNDCELARLVVMNTASIQLLPTTVTSLRAAMGSADPGDIIPCVLLSSLLSLTAGLTACEVLHRL